MSEELSTKIIIEGVTDSGEQFRPSDWAERVSGTLSTFQNHRIYYSPLLRPSVLNENKCVIIDISLKTINPDLFTYLIDFAHNNNLRIVGEINPSNVVVNPIIIN